MSFTINKGDILIQDFVCSAASSKDSHAQMLVKPRGGAVYLKNVKFTANGYNGLEQESGIHAGSDLAVSKVVIEDCKFEGTLSNNAISFYNLAEGCEILIKDCEFTNISNMLRISNNYNVGGIKIRLENCHVAKGSEDAAYRGLVLFQDYVSANHEAAESNNQFGPEKVSVEIVGCTYSDGEHMTEAGQGSVGDAGVDQMVYVYCNKGSADDKGAVISDPARLPTVTFA